MNPPTSTGIDPAIASYIDERLENLKKEQPGNRVTLVVFSGDFDRQLAALVIATGAAAMGMDVSIFYTFWGLTALKKKGRLKGKTWKEKMFTLMSPKGLPSAPVSKMNFLGAGRAMLKSMMRDKEVTSVEDLFAMAREMNVKMIACTMSMEVMGITKEELLDDVSLGGVATFLGDATCSKVSLFV